MAQAATSNEPRKRHAGSLYVCTVAGIPIYLHFTFVLLLLWIGLSSHLGSVLFVLGIFLCVVLHELGHALMALRYGIKTEDIVLYPIGGVARLRSLGEGMQEFWIAIAGPLVNVIIFVAIFAALKLTGAWTAMTPELESALQAGGVDKLSALQRLALVNVMLVLFNLIPAFPMDGGRVLRAVLSRWMPKAKATMIAARIGQGLAVLFILYGLLGPAGMNVVLMFVGLFIFLAAGQESMAVQTATLTTGKRARDAMISRFEVLSHGDSVGRAADVLLATSQQDFPVMGGSEVIGLLTSRQLLEGLASKGRDHYVAEIMSREFASVQAEAGLNEVLTAFQQSGGEPILVFAGDQLVGYINKENLMEFLTITKIAGLARPA
jgi:Zn-dependent protease/predicted transcriptional regulator